MSSQTHEPLPDSCLAGVVVLERADRLATALCGALLADLGATVIRCEARPPHWAGLSASACAQALITARAGKICLDVDPLGPAPDAAWLKLVDRADIILMSPGNADDLLLATQEGSKRIVCSITDAGLNDPSALSPDRAVEWELQACTGVMAVTGTEDGGPEAVQFPLLEMMAAINAATSVAAAVFGIERGARARLLDIAVLDAGIALMTTFLPSVQAGKRDGFRVGAGNHLSAPWNAYRTRTGWMQLCTFSDAEWRRVLKVIGRPEVDADERFKRVQDRAAHVDEVDRIIEHWTLGRSTEDAVEMLSAAGAAAGPIRTIADVLDDPLVSQRGVLQPAPDRLIPGPFIHFSRASTRNRSTPAPCASADEILRSLGPREETPESIGDPALPLAGIRILELGPYTAGPLAGRYLSDLGAEVIKIEPYGGEVTRDMAPLFDGWSGYFVNINVGKKFLCLDLRRDDDKNTFLDLARTADVLLTNLKPGALDRMGVGPELLANISSRLVICCVSGFGLDGSTRAALDTVVQGESGVMSLVGEGTAPHRVGVSIADQSAAHVAPLAVIAALRYRDRTGRGQVIDIAMYDVAVWLTHLNWPGGEPALRPWQVVRVKDGWVTADATHETLLDLAGPSPWPHTRAAVLAMLRAAGIRGSSVLELDEVFADDAVMRRALVYEVDISAARMKMLRSPHRAGMERAPVKRLCAAPDADRDELLSPATDG